MNVTVSVIKADTVYNHQTGEVAAYPSTHNLPFIAVPFEPHRLPLDEMEYTIMSQMQKQLTVRLKPVED